MLGRYAELKAQLPPGTILFYQVGTFFETFEEDANTISKELSTRLTSREAAGYTGGRVPLAGVPGHALQEHLATLLRKGHSVAVAEQRQHPTKPKQFTREVSRILTPGTVIEDNVLHAGESNYLAAVVRRDGRAGVAVVEASTGEFTGTEVPEEEVAAELERWSPREMVVPERTAAEDLPKARATISSAPRWTFEPSAREQAGAGRGLQALRARLGHGARRGDAAQPRAGRPGRDHRPDPDFDGPAGSEALARASVAGGGTNQPAARGRGLPRRGLHAARGGPRAPLLHPRRRAYRHPNRAALRFAERSTLPEECPGGYRAVERSARTRRPRGVDALSNARGDGGAAGGEGAHSRRDKRGVG